MDDDPVVAGEPANPAVGSVAAEPGRDRRRARRYLVVGALVVPFAVLVFLLGDPGPLTLLALAIGVVDLAIGAYLWQRSGSGTNNRP